MKFTDYFKKNFETSDNSVYKELETRYYRAKMEDGMTAVKEMIKLSSAAFLFTAFLME